jgi:hypothetical protein
MPRQTIPHLARGLLAGAVIGVLSACGTAASGSLHPQSATVTPASSVIPSGLLASGSTSADFLQITQAGNSVSGTETYYQYDQDSSGSVYAIAPQASTGTEAVSGIVEGTAVQLNIGTDTYTGSLNADGALDLEIPQSDGSLSVQHFVPATIDDYNAAIAPLQTEAAEWTDEYWEQTNTCELTYPNVDVSVFIGTGGESTCTAAMTAGWEQSTAAPTGDVTCFHAADGTEIAIAPGIIGDLSADNLCSELSSGTWP